MFGWAHYSPYLVWHYTTTETKLFNLETEQPLCNLGFPSKRAFALNDSYVIPRFNK
jgi:hypothetical protein